LKIPGKAIASGLALLVLLFVVLAVVCYRGPDCFSNADKTCLGLNTTAWTAIGAAATVAYAFLTLVLVVVAVVQIGSLKEQIRAAKEQIQSVKDQMQSASEDARINRTLIACDRYDTDLLLDRAARRLLTAPESLGDDPSKYRFDLESLLNYFETIAIGVRSKLYDENIVRDQLERIFLKKVKQYLLERNADKKGVAHKVSIADLVDVADGLAEEEYVETMALYKKWSPTTPAPETK